MGARPLPAERRNVVAAFGVLALISALGASACGGPTSSPNAGAQVVRIGYLPNLTHAPAIIGVEDGLFAHELGPAVELRADTFNAGPEAIEALFADALDIAYVGPNPAVNAWARSKGQAIRVLAGSTTGGAALVARPEIRSADQLKGQTIATPQLGGTQDVAARSWLARQGLSTDTSGGGDVSVRPQANADALREFQAGRLAGAWLAEPWATRLELEGDGRVLVDEASLWPGGRFITTLVIVRAAFLRDHRDLVEAVLAGHRSALDVIASYPEAARSTTNEGIRRITGKALPDQIITTAWSRLAFSLDPLVTNLEAVARSSHDVGLLDDVDLTGIYDLGPINAVLDAAGERPVQ